MPVLRQHVQRTVALLFGLWVLGVAALVLVEVVVPDSAVISALERGEDRLEIDAREQPYDNAGTRIDEWTECVTLGLGLGEHRGATVFETVALAPHLGSCQTMVEHLNPHDPAAAAAEERTYIRYWHGSVALVRPVVWLWGVAGLRAISSVLLLAAGVALVRAVRRIADARTAAALVAPYTLMTSVVSLPGSTHQAVALAVGIASIAWALGGTGGQAAMWYRCVLAGAAFSYVDLLTIVPGVWILCGGLFGLRVFQHGGSRRAIVTASIASGIAWMVGFAGMWFGKWAYASVVLGPSVVIEDVTDSVGFRLSGAYDTVDAAFGSAISVNVELMLERPFVGTTLVILLGAMLGVVRRGGVTELVTRLLVAAPSVLTFVWFEVLSNHSQIHGWFTYRSIPISFGLALMAMVAPAPVQGDRSVAPGTATTALTSRGRGSSASAV